MRIAYVDLEVNEQTKKIGDIGVLCGETRLHTAKVFDAVQIIQAADLICGHYFLYHDFHYLQEDLAQVHRYQEHIIDTLLLSPLLFPERPYHALNKDYKTEFAQSNNPLMDCQITRDLLEEEVKTFFRLPEHLKTIFYQLLHQQNGFAAFFKYIGFQAACDDLVQLIEQTFSQSICENVPLAKIIAQSPVALAYALSLIHCNQRHSITPAWVLHQFPEIERIFTQLRATPCRQACAYCQRHLNIEWALNKYFGYPKFREYDGKPLQAKAAQAAVEGKSVLAVFPTGGGKSVTFQVPALMAGEYGKALTVVISPLQSLMKDQVDNLEQRGITEAVTINGLLDPIERQKSLERVQDGSACLLYLAPESLRSRTIENVLLGRKIARFVIDEAHCFSAWGQDFRVDYLYIAEFIRKIQAAKKLSHPIPVSCFTATAKPQVIEDIKDYFKKELNLNLHTFAASVERKNLRYQVLLQKDDDERRQTLRDLIESHNCPTIVYVSRTKKTREVAHQLNQYGFVALPYHGKMDKEEKILNQNKFMTGEVQIIVATSAFGMGVDKKDVGLVVHYEISDSLENYVQEAGRAGRDENIQAACFVLFAPEDLDKHFLLLNQTKIAQKEINQIFKAIKDLCGRYHSITESALNIARQAGWHEDPVEEIETRVKTAIAALESVGYIKRGYNMPRIYANSILAKNAAEAIEKIQRSQLIPYEHKISAERIIKKLFSQRSHIHHTEEDAESRVDYIADILGLKTEMVVKIVSWLRQEKILADQQDLRAFIKKSGRLQDVLHSLNQFAQLERFLLNKFQDEGVLRTSLKMLNQECSGSLKTVNPKMLKAVLTFWKMKNVLARCENAHDEVALTLKSSAKQLSAWLDTTHLLAQFVLRYLYEIQKTQSLEQQEKSELAYVEFSVGELLDAFQKSQLMRSKNITLDDIEDVLFYLLRMGLLKIEGGFLVVYQRLHINRLIMDNRKQYTKEDYVSLARHYQTRQEQIHIVGKYAQMMLENVQAALKLINDYFSLDYRQFIRHYFPNKEKEALQRNMTQERFNQWFGNLSPTQLQIIQDNTSPHIVVFAAPGSGKTRVLVHKLASLYQLEDIKHEQLLMLTFSRAAAHEFRVRLLELIGNAAAFVEIKTFHSYCFDLLGRVGDLTQSDEIIAQAIAKIQSGEVEQNRIAKLVLVLDEAQDINTTQFELVKTLIAKNEEMRVIAVGDDDQTIYDFQGANPKYMRQLLNDFGATKYELSENYRSKTNIVSFCNRFAKHITQRLKEQAVLAVQTENGQVDYVSFSGSVMPYLLEKIQSKQHTQNTIAVLTQTNEEAIDIAGQLRQAKIPCQLVQTNEGFCAYDLLEVRVFEHYLNCANHAMIPPENWENAKLKTQKYLSRSKNLPLLNNILNYFEKAFPKNKYVSDWQNMLSESRWEDFVQIEQSKVFVSTMHKAKGREYDDVFVYLNQMQMQSDEKKRLLYVAFSRAKSHLTILSNQENLRTMCVGDGVNEIHFQGKPKTQSRELALYLGHSDVVLGKFALVHKAIRDLQAGDRLHLTERACFDEEGCEVICFSKKFSEKLSKYLKQGYQLSDAEVNFIVMWQDKNIDKEHRIVLPIVYLRKT